MHVCYVLFVSDFDAFWSLTCHTFTICQVPTSQFDVQLAHFLRTPGWHGLCCLDCFVISQYVTKHFDYCLQVFASKRT